MISGLYKEVFLTTSERKAKGTEIELRVDVDGNRPMNVVSGDIFTTTSRVRKHLSSFRFESVTRHMDKNQIIIIGHSGKFSNHFKHFKDLHITVPPNSSPLEATMKCFYSTGSSVNYFLKYKSKYFRTIHLEHDYEEGIVPFKSYNTNDLFSPFPHRSYPLTIAGSFAEAGIKIVTAKKKTELVPHPSKIAGQGAIWTDDELHSALLKHFKSLSEQAQWKVWLLSASEYAISNVKGTTLAHKGKKRVGCAVFQKATGWQNSQERRTQLFIYVHELGHCFNLPHAWTRPKASNTARNDNSLLSWMSYPLKYYSSSKSYGEEAFWKHFHFQFSDSELIHLRHAFRDDIIFWGSKP